MLQYVLFWSIVYVNVLVDVVLQEETFRRSISFRANIVIELTYIQELW